jgi:hypothetical protein
MVMPLSGGNIQIPKRITVPPRPLLRKVMASPPATTLSTALTIASPLNWSALNFSAIELANFGVYGAGKPAQRGTSFPQFYYVVFNSINTLGTTYQEPSYRIIVYHYGSEIEFHGYGSSGNLLVKVDDEYITLTPQAFPADGGQYRYYINFGSVGLRKLTFIAYNIPFGGLYTAQTDTIIPAQARGPRCIAVGDSFMGSGGYIPYLADVLGWDDVWASGVGSTGFLQTADGKFTYRQRLQQNVIDFAPDIVLFQGSINDNAFTAEVIAAEAELCFGMIKSALPNCTIICTSPLMHGGVGKTFTNSFNQCYALKTAVEKFGGYFLNLLELPLQSNLGIPSNSVTITANASSGATSLSIGTPAAFPTVTGTYKLPNNTRFRIKAITGSGPYTLTLDSGLMSAITSGTVATEVGGSLWTGAGRVGATTGHGNSDLFVSADGTHPATAGSQAIATAMANLMITSMGSSL